MKVRAILMFGAFCLSQTAATRPQELEDLRSSEPPTRMAAKVAILEHRQQVIRELIDIARTAREEEGETDPGYGIKHAAIDMLGEFRATEAVPVLYQNLKYKVKVIEGSLYKYSDPVAMHPAVASLIEIGEPAVTEAWRRIGLSDDDAERELCILVITRVQGVDVARHLLEKKTQVRDAFSKRHYAAALERLATMPAGEKKGGEKKGSEAIDLREGR